MKVKKIIEMLTKIQDPEDEIIAFWWDKSDLYGTENLTKKEWEDVVYSVDEADWYEMNQLVQLEVNYAMENANES
jgi:hypothetical protein